MLTNQHIYNKIYIERGGKMETLTSAINVQGDSKDKEPATSILKELGLNMSTFVNMAIKQLIKNDGIPFEVTNKPNKELLKAIKEGEDILNGKVNTKSYTNMYEMVKDLKK